MTEPTGDQVLEVDSASPAERYLTLLARDLGPMLALARGVDEERIVVTLVLEERDGKQGMRVDVTIDGSADPLAERLAAEMLRIVDQAAMRVFALAAKSGPAPRDEQLAEVLREGAEEIVELFAAGDETPLPPDLPAVPPERWRFLVVISDDGQAGANVVRELVQREGRRLLHLVAPTERAAVDMRAELRAELAGAGGPSPLFTLLAADAPLGGWGNACDVVWCRGVNEWGDRMVTTWKLIGASWKLGGAASDPKAVISTTPEALPIVQALLQGVDGVELRDVRSSTAIDMIDAALRSRNLRIDQRALATGRRLPQEVDGALGDLEARLGVGGG